MALSRIRPGSYDVLVVLAAIWFLAKFLRYAFPPLFEEIQASFQVSNTAVGVAFTGFMIVYAAMQFPSGLLADRFGSVRVITAGVVTATFGTLVVILGGPFELLVLAMLVLGAGTGAHKTVSIKVLALAYPSRTGRTLGVFDTVGTFGGVIAPIVVAAVVGFGVNWRAMFGVAAIFGAMLAVAVTVRVGNRVPSSGAASTARNHRLREYVAPFREPRLLAFVVLTLGFSFAYNGVVAFLPLYLVAEVGTTTAVASLLYSVLFAVSVVQVLTGELADHVGTLTVIAAMLSVATLSLGALVALPLWGAGFPYTEALVALAVVGVGVGSHGFRPVRGVHLEAMLPESLAGGGLGAVRSALMGAGAVAPALVGFTADAAGFGAAFTVLLGALGVATFLGILLLLTDGS